MKTARRFQGGFTLIEVLIVVVIMAVLAATIIPQFAGSTREAKTSALQFNQQTMRSQIELYKENHLGAYPAITNSDLPQMWQATNAAGTVGAAGTNFPFGPYINNALPTNPFNSSASVVAVATAGTVPTAAIGTTAGWQYDATTGGIYPNNVEYYGGGNQSAY